LSDGGPRPTAPRQPESPLREAAGNIGAGLDGTLTLLTRVPWQGWAAIVAIVCGSTFPFSSQERKLVGLTLDDRLSIWLSKLVVLAILAAVFAICFFLIRALFRYMEEDRWPRKAGGVEMDEFGRTQFQLAESADVLAAAAETNRILTNNLKEARDVIMFLEGELARERAAEIDEASDEIHRAQGE
jgi:hypothetical protein